VMRERSAAGRLLLSSRQACSVGLDPLGLHVVEPGGELRFAGVLGARTSLPSARLRNHSYGWPLV
jgi:hypothetical protein